MLLHGHFCMVESFLATASYDLIKPSQLFNFFQIGLIEKGPAATRIFTQRIGYPVYIIVTQQKKVDSGICKALINPCRYFSINLPEPNFRNDEVGV